MNKREKILDRLKEFSPPTHSQRKVAAVEIKKGNIDTFTEKAVAAGAVVYAVEGLEGVKQQLTEILATLPGDIIYSSEEFLQEISLSEIAKASNRQAIEGAVESKANYKLEVLASAIGITSCDYALAETGSVILEHKYHNERLISLAPETHICILKEEQILENRFMLAKILDENTRLPSAYSIITGVSRTADVALQVVLGMHGPKKVFLIVMREEQSQA